MQPSPGCHWEAITKALTQKALLGEAPRWLTHINLFLHLVSQWTEHQFHPTLKKNPNAHWRMLILKMHHRSDQPLGLWRRPWDRVAPVLGKNSSSELIKVNKGRCLHGFLWIVRKSSLRSPLVVFSCLLHVTDQYVLTLEGSNKRSASVHYWHPVLPPTAGLDSG